MAIEKWITVVVDRTAATGRYWKSILSDYLEKIIRNVSGKPSPHQNASAFAIVYLGLVLYNSHEGCLIRPSPWTRDVEGFLGRLSALQFSDGGDSIESSVAHGLAEALTMFPKPIDMMIGTETGICEVVIARERHCILVGSSNPKLTPTFAWMPLLTDGEFSPGTNTRVAHVVAQDVAKLYAQCNVSLSVICPKQFPKLKEIYDARYIDDLEGPAPYYDANNPDLLLLLSKEFLEVHAALFQYAETRLSAPKISSLADIDFSETFDASDTFLLPLLSFGASSPGRESHAPLPALPSQEVSKTLSTDMQWNRDKSEPVWEGTLLARHERRLVLVHQAKAYDRIKSASGISVTAGWKRILLDGIVIPLASVDRSYAGQAAHDLIFELEVKDGHNISELLHVDKLCIRYMLPNQSLILTARDRKHLNGKVYAVKSSTASAGHRNQ